MLTVKDCILRDLDSGSVDGGGIRAFLIDLDVIGCHFLRCYGDYGGGLGTTQCATRVIDSIFEDCENNAIRQITGDIYVYDESLTIEGCRFIANYAELSGGAVYEHVDGDVRITGCWFEGNTAEAHSGAVCLSGLGVSGSRLVEGSVFWDNHAFLSTSWGGALRVHISTEIRNCTFVGNSAGSPYDGGAAVFISGGSSLLANCIVADSQNQEAIGLIGGSLSSTCNDFWNNEEGIGQGWTPDPTDFEADPLFCDPNDGNFELSSQSPCLPPGSGSCGLIGAFGEGCGAISVEELNWGRIKGQYRGKNGGGR
jgi:hypothetical protein